MTAGPYSIGSDHWPGLSKVIEECGEVIQAAGKIIAANGDGQHWDGSDLRQRLEDEIADEKQRKVYNIESRILSTLRVIGDPAGLAARFDADAVTRAVEAMEAAR